jgi:hypothetical protein
MTAFGIKDNELSKVFPFTQIDGFIQRPIGIGDLTNKILGLIGAAKRRILRRGILWWECRAIYELKRP